LLLQRPFVVIEIGVRAVVGQPVLLVLVAINVGCACPVDGRADAVASLIVVILFVLRRARAVGGGKLVDRVVAVRGRAVEERSPLDDPVIPVEGVEEFVERLGPLGRAGAGGGIDRMRDRRKLLAGCGVPPPSNRRIAAS
jgi:hypothetical protein